MKRILICIGLFLSFVASAQPSEATLVVTGEGMTKEEAINQALRSAIEQAFGVFVSANTDILNDDIVKDEIATLTTGNIKSFVELASMDLPSGGKSVTLQAVVSIGKLVEYSKSHGSKAEFAGALFGANLKMRELNKRNEVEVISNFLSLIDVSGLFNANISLGTPFLSNVRESEGKVSTSYSGSNPSYPNWSTKEVEIKQMYNLDVTINYYITQYGSDCFRQLLNLLNTISLKEEEIKQYNMENEPYFAFSISNSPEALSPTAPSAKRTLALPSRSTANYSSSVFYLRSSVSLMVLTLLCYVFRDALFETWKFCIYYGDSDVNEYMLKNTAFSPTHNLDMFAVDLFPDEAADIKNSQEGQRIIEKKYNLAPGSLRITIINGIRFLADKNTLLSGVNLPKKPILAFVPFKSDKPVVVAEYDGIHPCSWNLDYKSHAILYSPPFLKALSPNGQSPEYQLHFAFPISKEEIVKITRIEFENTVQ